MLLTSACGTSADSPAPPSPCVTADCSDDAVSDGGTADSDGGSRDAFCKSNRDCSSSRTCCNGRCVDTSTDIANCGTCGAACSQQHVVATCAGGECAGACDPGWTDCNANLRKDGCEAYTAGDLNQCAGCSAKCSANNVPLPTCTNGLCDGACAAGTADCNGDKLTDGCEVLVATDPNHCGGCGAKCSTNNVPSPTCTSGLCDGACTAGTADCNGDKLTDGCEVLVATDPDHCGGCGAKCSVNNIPSPTCTNGLCDGACAAGTADCNGDKLTDGCEVDTRSSTSNCGSCGASCSSSHIAPLCASGVCTGACDAGWADCDDDKRTNGCETDIRGTPAHCGICGAACSTNHVPTPTCASGVCTGACAVGWDDCNGDKRTDGCETDVTSNILACGGCGQVCSPNHVVSRTCTAGICTGTCAPNWADCDNDKRTNGCEVDTQNDWRNCGGCGDTCARQCVAGTCACRVGLSGVPLPQSPLPEGQRIHPALVTDVDGDGRADLIAVPREGTAEVLVYLNTGGGFFGVPTAYMAGPGSHRVASGDLNRDGRPDLAVSNSSDQSVTVFMNQGGGQFGVGVRYVLATTPSDVAIADVDRDGYADLVVADRYASSINIALNRGDGTFPDLIQSPGAVKKLSVGSTKRLKVVDLNGDGAVDFVTAGLDKVSVLLNQGTGTFAPRVEYPVATAAADITVGDFDGDGRPDIVTASSILGGGGVSFLANAGLGTFAPYVWSATGGTPWSLAVGDFDADGQLDLAAAQEPGAPIVILGYQGAGTFAVTRSSLWNGIPMENVVAGDVDNDGSPDLFFDGDRYGIGVLLSKRGDYLTPPRYLTAVGPSSVAIGDLDGDGKLDLAVAAEEDDRVSVLLNSGDGTFGPRNDYVAHSSPRSVAIGDIDGDGRPDLVAAGGNSFFVSIFRNLGSGTFAPRVEVLAGQSPYAVALGDLDGDGQTDIVVANVQASAVSVLLNRGAGTFSRTEYPIGSNPLSVAIADVDGDGHRDVVVACRSLGVLLNTGTGALQNVALYPTVAAPQSVAIGDLDHDGLVDLAVVGGGTPSVLAIHSNAGGGQFPTHADYPVQWGSVPVAMADLDGNGALDVIVGHTNGNLTVGVFLNDGSGLLGRRQDYFAGHLPQGLAVGDLDGDGRTDVAVTNNYNGLGALVRVLFNTCL